MQRYERDERLSVSNDLGFQFEEPAPSAVLSLQDEIDAVADFLGKEPREIRIPEWGFLQTPLTVEQKRLLDDRFEPEVAAFITTWENSIKGVPIQESGERMVDLRAIFDQHQAIASFSERTFHPACGEWGNQPKVFWAREHVVEQVVQATKAFNHIGIAPHIEDGFRPAGVQEGLFQRRIDAIRAEHPDWNDDLLIMEAMTKTAGSPWNAGHKAGAAVDMTLRTLEGRPLDLGNSYPDGGVIVALECPFVTFEQFRTRQIFAQTMRMTGMSIYPGEDWHASYGDALSAMDVEDLSRFEVVYAPIKRFDLTTGEVDPYDPGEYYENFPVRL